MDVVNRTNVPNTQLKYNKKHYRSLSASDKDIFSDKIRFKIPKDETVITINGKVLDRKEIKPIKIPEQFSIKVKPKVYKFNKTETTEAKQNKSDVLNSFNLNIPKNIPNYSSMSPKEQAKYRAEFRTKFGILRNAWPNYHIPDFSDDIPLEQVHAQYEVYIKHINISKEVDQYKIYLVIMWLVIELFCIKIGFNMKGYTISQMKCMNKYERLLIELGETNYKSVEESKSKWPVEIRIFFMSIINAVTFIIIKMLANYVGENTANTIVDTLTSYLTGSTPQTEQKLLGSSSNSESNTQESINLNKPGIDIASLIGNIGSLLLNNQNNNVPSQPTTPKFQPVYND